MSKVNSKKPGKFISIIVILAIFAIPIFSLGVRANNHTDTDKKYLIPSWAFSWTDAARYKEDMSSSYQKCVSSSASYSSWVYGSSVSRPRNLGDCEGSLRDPNGSGQGTPHYSFSTGVTRYMQNWVRENYLWTNDYPNMRYAGMMFMGGKGYQFQTHIRWSPDSI